MKTIKTRFVEIVSYFFILLFCYATVSKIMDFENFQIQIAQSPLLSSYAAIITYGILIMELLVCVLLIFQKTRNIGLYGSYILMVLFSVYIYLILNYSEFIPCSCGGILEKMDWNTHLMFNLICIILASIAIVMNQEKPRISTSRIVSSLLLSALLCSIVMYLLYQRSEYIVKKDNGFQRRFLQHPILKDKTFDLKLNSYYFAGFNGDTLYLGNYTAPFSVTKIANMSEVKTQNISLNRTDLEFRSPILEVTDSIIYLYDGKLPVVFEGSTSRPFLKEQNIGKTYYRKIRNLDHDRFVIGAFHRKRQIQTLGILSRGSKDSVVLRPELLEKREDGFFEADGQLSYDRFTKKIVYVYNYTNQFVVTDRKLNSKIVFRTIDTIRTANLGLSILQDGNKKLNNPLIVNKRSTVYKGILFIESDRRGKLERDRGKKAIILDLYSIQEQKYFGSISVPNSKEGQRVQFTMHNDNLYLIIENELIRYRFAQNIIQHFISGEAENLNKE